MRTLSDHVFDLIQNSIVAGAENIHVSLEEDVQNNKFKIIIIDDGFGIKSDQMSKVKNTFFTTRSRKKRKVGLGLSLMDATCKMTGGSLTIQSRHRYGTTITAIMEYDHIDRPPLGDIADMFTSLFLSTPENKVKWKLEHVYNENGYTLTNRKTLDETNTFSFTEAGIKEIIYGYIKKKEDSINS